MEMNYIRRGAGNPLLLIHGIGGDWRSWQPILDDLALERDVIAVDLDEFLYNLAYGETQKGAPKNSIVKPLVAGWGRRDRVCFPNQAARALELFPDAQLHWFERCGHFPQWDKPAETARLILDATRGKEIAAFASASKNGGEA